MLTRSQGLTAVSMMEFLNSLNIDLWDDVDSLVDLSGEMYIADQSRNGVKKGTFRGRQ